MKYIIKYKDLYLVNYRCSSFSNRVITFYFDDCFENAIEFLSLKNARAAQQKIGIGEIYEHVDEFKLIE